MDDKIKEDRKDLFEATADDFRAVQSALESLPYASAVSALRSLKEIRDYIIDPLGEYVGKCIVCEESMFDDDAVTADEDGDAHAHGDCLAKLQRENPGAFQHADESPASPNPEEQPAARREGEDDTIEQQMLTKAWCDGANAHNSGFALEQNPFLIGGRHANWHAGWKEAAADAATAKAPTPDQVFANAVSDEPKPDPIDDLIPFDPELQAGITGGAAPTTEQETPEPDAKIHETLRDLDTQTESKAGTEGAARPFDWEAFKNAREPQGVS